MKSMEPMRAASRVVVAAAIVAGALALNALEPPCPPPAQPELHWVGQSTGCTEGNAVPCELLETIVFSVTPAGGGSYPECAKHEWIFGDDGSSSTEASPSHVHVQEGTFPVSVRVTGGDEPAFDGKPIIVVTTEVPKIEYFGASARSIRRGQTVVLSWSAKNVTRVVLEPIGAAFVDPAVTSYTDAPTVTTTYTLTAFGPSARLVSHPVTVIVGAKRRAVRR